MYGGVKIGIGTPSNGSIHIKTHVSILATVRLKNFDGNLASLTQEGCMVHWNRAEILQAAFEKRCTHLWFVDTDMVFAPTALWQLLELDKDIAGARYNLRRLEQLHSTVKTIEPDGTIVDLWLDQMPQRPFNRVDGSPIILPTGFMLIRLEALKNMPPPYFECSHPIGEDVYFGKKVIESGVDVWCDPTIEVGHIGEAIY